MRRFWAKASVGLAIGLAVGGSHAAVADLPTLGDLQSTSTESPLDAALKDEAFAPGQPTVYPGNYYTQARRFGLPPMMGDFFPGYSGGARQSTNLARLLVVADDLDAPGTLPAGNQLLMITEAGPLGIFQTSLNSVQDLQALLRAGQPLPPATQLGSINADATLTTAISIANIQALLASTPGLGFDIIPLQGPPGTYLSAVDAVFRTITSGGVTEYDPTTSGALLQGGVDTLNGGEDLDAFYFYNYVMRVNVPTPSAGTAGVGRSRISENGTTTPQDRLFLDYGFFDRVGLVAGSTSLNRFTPGFEKTFVDGLASLELRVPMACTVNDTIFQDGSTSTDDVRLGNLAVYLKGLLYEENGVGVSGGLGVVFPTADGFSVNFTNGGRLVEIDNEAFHLQPFLGGYYAPNRQFFTQAFAQLDFDVNGNPVSLNSTGTGLQQAGRLNDATFLFLDWSIGYWLVRGAEAPVLPVSSFHEHGQITQANHQLSIAPTLELHYARSLETAESVSAGNLRVGNFNDSVETLTVVVGTQLEIGENTNIGLGYATSIAGGNNEPFDGAFRLTLNQFFGRK